MHHIIQSSRISKLMKRYEAFMEGKDATNLADAIEENFQQMEKLESSYQDAEVKMDKALSGITSTFHKLGIVKYDAFKEMGGNLSFLTFPSAESFLQWHLQGLLHLFLP